MRPWQLLPWFLKRKLTKQAEEFPAGHFHSAIPDREAVRRDAARIFARHDHLLPGIDLRAAAQLELLVRLAQFHDDADFPEQHKPGQRYWFENPYFSWSDALCLFGMLRHLQPRRLVEVGGGFSSALVLDTNDRFLNGAIHCTFIDPHPERLQSLLREGDVDRVTMLVAEVQSVELSRFQELAAGDMLLVDSSHVCKTGSDVNHLLFEVLPTLQRGVFVHFHDVHYPFEYPEDWVYGGRAWNEAYVLRAFLQCNAMFRIALWNDYLARHHRQRVQQLMPRCLRNTGGSLWIEKIG